MKNTIYIPARFGSKRFHGKLLKKVGKDSILENIVSKIKKINFKPVIV